MEITELATLASDLPAFKGKTDSFLERVKDFKCESLADFERGKEYRLAGKALENEIVNHYKPIKQGIDASKQQVLDMEKTDLNGVKRGIEIIDNAAVAFKREQDRIAQVEADRKAEEDRQRKLADQQREAALLKEFGDEEGAKEVESKPPEPTRQFTASSGLSYARGVRTKPVWKAKIVAPAQVTRKYCKPDELAIKLKVEGDLRLIKNPTPDQLKALIAEIGGIELILE